MNNTLNLIYTVYCSNTLQQLFSYMLTEKNTQEVLHVTYSEAEVTVSLEQTEQISST